MSEVYIVWYDSRLLGRVFHGVYESEELAEAEVKEQDGEGLSFWWTSMKLNSAENIA